MGELIPVFLLALGLSMDAFAVSVSNGICYQKEKKKLAVSAISFGVFQALMPLLGYLAGAAFSTYVSIVDHWIALILLGFLGGKMLFEAIKNLRNPEGESCAVSFTYKLIVTQSIATSIDALAAGVTLAVAFPNTNPYFAVALIGVVTALCCLFGAFAGKRFGALMKDKAAVFGGLILIAIGVKIFVEHMFFS
ncbi:MAG: manganese efflux pump [Clostridia bacterium]|nr:manganese efflux pump [Clostridia bacterium]MBQ5743186.1 manganese efflux pump [Clostridia bacterium]